jgi:hypothetical protein
MEITNSSLNSGNVIIRHTYELVNNLLYYKIEYNPNLIGKFHEHISSEEGNEISGELVPKLPASLAERLFYNLGNRKI